MPICLPFGEVFPDSQGEAFVAGWGVKEDKECTTGKNIFENNFLKIKSDQCFSTGAPTILLLPILLQ